MSGSAQFRTTRWSVVLEAARPGSPGGLEAFATLYRDYWYPLYAYVRRRGWSPHEAEDLTQDFMVALFERQRLTQLDREGGRFRSFLLKSLQNFLANAWDRASAQKRGGGCAIIPLAEVDAESRFLADPASGSPERTFEHAWALTVIEHAMQRLDLEMRTAGKERLWEHLRPHLQSDRNGSAYAQIATALGTTEGAVKVAVHRLRRRYGELLRAELARTVDADTDVAAELRHLRAVVSA